MKDEMGIIEKNGVAYKPIPQMDGTLDEVVQALHAYNTNGISAYYEFNGHVLLSNMSIDDAYLEVLGLDKDSYDRIAAMEAEAKLHASPEAIYKFDTTIALGDSVIPEQFRISLHGMACESLKQGYGCKEFDCTFAVIEALEDGVALTEAVELMDEYGLDKTTQDFVAWEVQELSTRGDAFYEFAVNGVDIEQTTPTIGNL